MVSRLAWLCRILSRHITFCEHISGRTHVLCMSVRPGAVMQASRAGLSASFDRRLYDRSRHLITSALTRSKLNIEQAWFTHLKNQSVPTILFSMCSFQSFYFGGNITGVNRHQTHLSIVCVRCTRQISLNNAPDNKMKSSRTGNYSEPNRLSEHCN